MKQNTNHKRRLWLRRVVRWTIIAVVCGFVWKSLHSGFSRLDEVSWQLQPWWLVAAGGTYLAGWLPAWWFWHRTLTHLGVDSRIYDSLRAYYVSQLGKYVPGKAMVIVLRVGLLDTNSGRKLPMVVSVFVETLTSMAVGGCLAAICLLQMSHNQPSLWLIGLGLMLLAGLPTLPPVFNRILARLPASSADESSPCDNNVRGDEGDRHEAGATRAAAIPNSISWSQVLVAWPQLAAGWVVQGAGVGMVLSALSLRSFTGFEDWVFYTGGVSLAIVAGFLSGIPGGLGVRDGLLAVVLADRVDPEAAVIAAALWRLVSLVSEVVVSAILYVLKPRKP